MVLERIKGPADVKRLSPDEMKTLAAEMRDALLHKVSARGGHFGPNFGMVEATIALHYVFNSPEDKIVFDVSHQSYPHKMLTGRADAFLYPEKYNQVSGYSEPTESEHDHFVIGHTSTSISLASGLVKGRDLLGGKENVIAVIGDGSLSGGEAFEGLDFAGELGTNFIIIANDNQMSIAENHGGLYKSLQELRESNGTSSNNYFKSLGLDYMYVAEGNDTGQLIQAFSKVKDIDHPIVVHINTLKGKGYKPAEEHKENFHWTRPFDMATGKPLKEMEGEDYGEMTALHLLEKMKEEKGLVGITAGTPAVMGFTQERREAAGKQFVDVGIAEEHAVSMAGGLAKQGMVPVVALYSTFLQRSYDQIMQDVAMLHLHVVFAIDRAGLVGDDGPTHHGVFDIGFLKQVPGMRILNPASLAEQKDMLRWAVRDYDGPVAIRYPRGTEGSYKESGWQGLEGSLVQCHLEGKDVALITYGSTLDNVLAAAEQLKEQGIDACVLRLLSVWPLPAEELAARLEKIPQAVIIEETASGSGIRESLGWTLEEILPGCKIHGIDLGGDFVPHGSLKELYRRCGLDSDSIAAYVRKVLAR